MKNFSSGAVSVLTYLSFERRQMQNEANKKDGCRSKENDTGCGYLVVLVSSWQFLYMVGEEAKAADSEGDQMEEYVGPREL